MDHLPPYLQSIFSKQSYLPNSFFLIAGPCVVESEELVMEIAEKLATLGKAYGIPCVFKASYRKANRTSAGSFTGIGDDLGLSLVKKAGDAFGLPTTSDIHSAPEASMAAPFVDILQMLEEGKCVEKFKIDNEILVIVSEDRTKDKHLFYQYINYIQGLWA